MNKFTRFPQNVLYLSKSGPEEVVHSSAGQLVLNIIRGDTGRELGSWTREIIFILVFIQHFLRIRKEHTTSKRYSEKNFH